MTPTIVISKPDAHQERIVISDFNAPTAKCATIFYTTNSTTPTHNGATPTGTTLVYTGPVTVGKCNEIFFEALAYKSGMADSNVTTYDAIFGGTTCGSAPLVSDSGALSGAGETGNKSTSSRSRGRRDDASSDYRLVAYTEGTSSAFGRSNAHRFMSGRPTRYDTSADMADGGFMRVALNSSSPRRLSSGASTASTSSSTSTTTVVFTVWDGDWAVLEEYTTGNILVQKYLEGYHGLVKTLVDNIYYYQDELGSTSHVASATGALLEYYKYDLYGKPTYFSSASQQLNSSAYNVVDLGNGGARWIPELALYDDRNRFMSPDLGRFLQPDPIGFKGDASNLYRYCGNDWANRTDPTGEIFGVDDAINAGVGALIGLGGQLLEDSISVAGGGHWSGWESYTGAALGGAVGGFLSEYVTPIGGAAAGSAASNAITQGLKNWSGAQHGFQGGKVVEAGIVGAATHEVPGVRIKSYSAITKAMETKLSKGTIHNVSLKTAAKMATGKVANESGHVAVEAATNAAERGTESSTSSGHIPNSFSISVGIGAENRPNTPVLMNGMPQRTPPPTTTTAETNEQSR